MDHEETTTDPHYANDRNFFKVELWTPDDLHVERMLYAGNSLDRAREIFGDYARHRPADRLMIRQRGRVIAKWPPED
jgi:hypothetical protein